MTVSTLYSSVTRSMTLSTSCSARSFSTARPAVGRCRRVRTRDAVRAAVVGLPQRPVAHRRHHQVAAALGVGHQIVLAAVGVVHAGPGAQRDQQRQLRARRPPRRHEQAIGDRLAGAGEVVDAGTARRGAGRAAPADSGRGAARGDAGACAAAAPSAAGASAVQDEQRASRASAWPPCYRIARRAASGSSSTGGARRAARRPASPPR